MLSCKPPTILLLCRTRAHKDVAMILLQILDEGSISQGRKVDFKVIPKKTLPIIKLSLC